ncbi:MAG: cupredoxin domain-containing protein [Nitrososphaeraceae archaeon]|nr:cupredoxin domain-containing protein [Nitrososphaeraceae archaeon]
MSTDDDSHIVRTTPRRLGKGIAIIVGIMIIGAVYGIMNFEHNYSIPPPSSKLKPQVDLKALATFERTAAAPSAASTGSAAEQQKPTADVTLTILEGAATQGNPDYEPKELTVKQGESILVDNKDAMPHTVTNGEGPSDTNSGKIFDTSIINSGESAVIETADIEPGTYNYYCTVHPYMTGTLTIEK